MSSVDSPHTRPRFEDSIVLVTGAGGGLGRTISNAFAQEGATVAVIDLDRTSAESTAEMIRTTGGTAIACRADVSESQDVQESIKETLKIAGRIDILVNNAGINDYRHPVDFGDESWQRIIDVNLTGVWLFCRYVAPHMINRRTGSIVNIASAAFFQTSYFRAPYMASKGGVGNLTRALALDFARDGIRVNAVAPGMMDTGMSRPNEPRPGYIPREFGNWCCPMGRFAETEEVADAVLFLASERASYITGQILAVDGGLTAGNPLGLEWPPQTSSAPSEQEDAG